MLAQPAISLLKPRRKVPALLGRAPFADEPFSEWAHEHGEIKNVTPQRVEILAGEFADFMECAPRQSRKPTNVFDGHQFNAWMQRLGLLSDITPKQMAEYLTWYCHVVGRCPTPAITIGKLLAPYGWVRYRGKQRAVAGKINKPCLYKLEVAK